MLRLCGAELREVPAVPYTNPDNYVHVSERLANELDAAWANQWDNTANRDGHFQSTGPEIWAQTGGKVASPHPPGNLPEADRGWDRICRYRSTGFWAGWRGARR